MANTSTTTTTDAKKPWSLEQTLDAFHCCSPVFPNDYGVVVRVYDKDTIAEAFKRLIDNRVMALPVVDHVTGRPLYCLSVLHLVHYFMHLFKKEDFQTDVWHTIQNLLMDKASVLHTETVGNIQKFTQKMDEAHTIDEHAHILDAVKELNKTKAHRLIVTNKEGELVNLITQSRVFQFIGSMVDGIPIASKTVGELHLGSHTPITISNKATAYDAFHLMKEKGLSALPVVDDSGVLVGNISSNDIKLVGFDGKFWSYLGKNITEYLALLAKANPDLKVRSHVFALLQEDNQPPIVVKCKESHTLAFVIRIMNFYRVHRLYIVDEQGKPTGVISLTDVMAILFP